MKQVLTVIALCAGLVAGAQAQENRVLKPVRLEEPEAIRKALEAIPVNDATMGYKHFGERLERIGLSVKRIDIEAMTAADEKDDPQHVKRGDLTLTILTSPTPSQVKALCPLSELFHVVKRGSQWIPQDRSANWLLNGHGHCRAPD